MFSKAMLTRVNAHKRAFTASFGLDYDATWGDWRVGSRTIQRARAIYGQALSRAGFSQLECGHLLGTGRRYSAFRRCVLTDDQRARMEQLTDELHAIRVGCGHHGA